MLTEEQRAMFPAAEQLERLEVELLAAVKADEARRRTEARLIWAETAIGCGCVALGASIPASMRVLSFVAAAAIGLFLGNVGGYWRQESRTHRQVRTAYREVVGAHLLALREIMAAMGAKPAASEGEA